MIKILRENGSPSELQRSEFKNTLSKLDLSSFKRAVSNYDVKLLIGWYLNNKTLMDSIHSQFTFLPYLIYLLSSIDPIFASNFLHQFIKRNNIRHVTLRN